MERYVVKSLKIFNNAWKKLGSWLNEDDKCCTENLTLLWMVVTFRTKRQKKKYKLWQYQLRCFLFCSSTLCRWRRYTWNNVHLLNLSHHCDQKVLHFTLKGSMDLYFDTAAEYINSYTSKGRVLWSVTGDIQWSSNNLDYKFRTCM